MIVTMQEGEPGKAGRVPSSPQPGGGRPAASAQTARQRRRLLWAVIALAVAVAVVAWLVTRGDGSDEGESEPAVAGFGARIVDEGGLEDIAASAEHPVYWAGLMDGKEMAASETKEGNVQVRYLEEGAKPGAEPKKAITIGSYPLPDPAKALDGYAKRKGAVVLDGPEGRELVSNVETPSSIYFASPENSVQVEVYAPTFKRSLSLARSGKVQPVG